MEAEVTRARVSGPGAITLHGDIDRGAESDVGAAYEAAQKGQTGTLTLDFGDVSYINSTGIAVIVGVLARARKDGITVEAHGLSDHYRHVFQITRLSDFMKIHEDGQVQTGGVA